MVWDAYDTAHVRNFRHTFDLTVHDSSGDAKLFEEYLKAQNLDPMQYVYSFADLKSTAANLRSGIKLLEDRQVTCVSARVAIQKHMAQWFVLVQMWRSRPM